jgi:mono/diheme cytochrome c family protein
VAMNRRLWLAGGILAVGAAVALAVALSAFSLSARGGPGPIESYLAGRAKRFFVARDARGLEPLPPTPISVTQGLAAYSGSCVACHGVTGRKPTDIGRALYPPAPALDSSAVQQYSDEELFWIIKNGIRLTGMPSFAGIHTDREIWDVVYYLRSLKKLPAAAASD